MMFKEPVHRIVDWIKNESYFRWPNKMGGDLFKSDKGHTTEQCRVLKDHLGQLVKAGYLKEFMMNSRNRSVRQGAQQKGNPFPPPLGVIEVIHAASRGTAVAGRRGVLTVAPVENCLGEQPP